MTQTELPMAQKSGKTTKYLFILWSLYTLPVVLFIVIMVLIGHGKMGFLPDFAELENPQTNLATVIITEDGEQLGKYFVENRTFVNFDESGPPPGGCPDRHRGCQVL